MIEERRIIENLQDISFPRLSGTEFEKEAFNIVKKKIEALDLSPIVQKFSFSIFYSRIYPKLALTLLSWLLIVLFLNISIIFNIVNLSLICFLILIIIKITRNPENIKVGREFNSQNIFTKILSKPKNENSEYKILLISHLDSKGQTFSIKIRIRLYYIWVFTFLLDLLFIILNSFFLTEKSLILDIISLLILIINIIPTFLLWINNTNNKSKGAIDNASGVSCVLELLYYYSRQKNMLKNYDLWFVFTGAEESGTMGIRNFYQYIKDFNKEKTFISNFDSIANKINLWDHGLLNNKYYKASNFILENKDLMRLEKTRRFYIGTYSDGLFLLNKKFPGLGNGDKSSYNYIHSVDDDIDKINTKTLKKLCKFYTILLKEVDNNFHKTEGVKYQLN
jgi:hypothetical protein